MRATALVALAWLATGGGIAGAQELPAHEAAMPAAAASMIAVAVPISAVEDMKALRQDVMAALERETGRGCEIRLALRTHPERPHELEAFGWCVEDAQ